MGEFSDYFETHPEEQPGYIDPERKAEMERMRIANEKLNEGLLRKPFNPSVPPANKPKQ